MKAVQIPLKRLLIVLAAFFLTFTLIPASTVAAKVGTNILEVPGSYPTIQAAIDAASPDDRVLVAPGTYVESIRMKYGVIVEGSGAEVTTIQGDGSWFEYPYQTYTVLGDNNSEITGFEITGSLIGVLCSESSPTISKNFITGNKYGIDVVWESSPIVINNIITGNNWFGIEVVYSSPTIANNVISGSDYGIRVWGSDPTIANNVIVGNGLGGIDSKNESPSLIVNNTIIGNGGYGIRCLRNTQPIVANNIVAGHSGYGIICEDNSNADIGFNDIWNNGTDYYGCSAGPGDISVDPMFVDPAAEDYRLVEGSPVIDAGTNDAPSLPAVDFDGNLRIVDGNFDGWAVADMGAFEFQVVHAEVEINPKTLNLDSKGEWVKAKITLPEPYLAVNVDISTVILNGVFADNEKYEVEGRKLVAWFDRAAVENFIGPGEVELTATGKVDGLVFSGSDKVKVVSSGREITGKNISLSIDG